MLPFRTTFLPESELEVAFAFWFRRRFFFAVTLALFLVAFWGGLGIFGAWAGWDGGG